MSCWLNQAVARAGGVHYLSRQLAEPLENLDHPERHIRWTVNSSAGTFDRGPGPRLAVEAIPPTGWRYDATGNGWRHTSPENSTATALWQVTSAAAGVDMMIAQMLPDNPDFNFSGRDR